MAENTTGIKWALSALRVNATEYTLTSQYYDGKHRLSFATDKFHSAFGHMLKEFSVNLCGLVVDIPSDRLQLDGFEVVADESEDTTETQRVIDEILRRNRMNKRAGEVHKDAFKTGDAYVVVDWVNSENPGEPRATIYPNPAGRCAVLYDDENPGVVKQAAKWWAVRDLAANKWFIRLNLYFPDRVEKYQTKPRTNSELPTRDGEFMPIEGDWQVPNPYGKVPVFHLGNNADMGCLGRSEIADIIAPQDGYNKSICDALVGSEYAVLGQRWVTGLDLEEDGNGNVKAPFKDGLANVWVAPPQKDKDGNTIPGSEAQPIQFGQFTPANIQQVLALKAEFRKDISIISGIPPHYFMETGGVWPSGESLKTAETRLTNKVRDRQIAFGNVWEDVMRLCLEIEGIKDVQLKAKWADTSPRSETEDIANATNKVEKLKVPLETVWGEVGYSPGQIERMKEQQDEQARDELVRSTTAVVPTVARNGRQ